MWSQRLEREQAESRERRQADLAHIGNQRETIARLRRQQDPDFIADQALEALSVVTGRTVETLRAHGLGTLTARRVLEQGA